MKNESLQNACTFLLPSSSRPRQKESGGVKLHIRGSAELTALPAGKRDTAGDALSKLQDEHISTDTQSLYKTVSP